MTPGRPRAAFYCVADERYFLGAVALVNSLRLVGHREPVFVLDRGLRPAQRDLLGSEVELVDDRTDAPAWLSKTIAPLRHPADVCVLVDSDVIVTRPLRELVDRAAAGRVVAFRDRQQRWCPEWGELLDLGAARRTDYVSSGLMLLGAANGERVLRLLDERQERVDFERTFWRRNERDYPFLYADQDVVNAIIATRLEPGDLVALDNRLSPNPPYRGLRVVDEATLRCAYRDGVEPYAVHQYVRKPWLEPTFHGVYPRLLRRLLIGPGLAMRVPERDVPKRLRHGLRAGGERVLVDVRDFLRWRFGDRLPRPIATRVEDARRRRAAGG